MYTQASILLAFALVPWVGTAEDPIGPLLAWIDQEAAAGSTTAAARATATRVAIAADPGWFDSLHGKHEWAYRSLSDDSLQPFTIVLPDRAATPPPWPMVVVLHGGGGTHQTKRTEFPPGVCYLHVLGQGRSARWRGLSENDVREAMAAVCAWWPVDRQRIAVTGHSLGGAGSYVLASRHPDWFIAAAPTAGWGGGSWPGNLLATPLLAVTSRDDTAIHRFSRAMIQAVSTQGGQANHLITDHIGHGFPAAFSGTVDQWVTKGKPLIPPAVFRFVAEDAAAATAWGVAIVAWGDAPLPAKVAWSRVSGTFSVTTDNVAAVELSPASWGHPPDAPLRIMIDGTEVANFPSQVPARIPLVKTGTWRSGEGSPLPHAPGGLDAVLHGDRVCVVYGTAGDAATIPARRALAERLARMPWAGIRKNPERFTGSLPVLTDQEALSAPPHGNIILIGSCIENRLAATWQDRLPASFDTGRLKVGDAIYLVGGCCASVLGKVGDRQVVWIVDGEGPVTDWDRLPFRLLGNDTRSGVCPDLLIAAEHGNRLVVARRLTGAWNWCEPSVADHALPATRCSAEQLAHVRAECLRRAAGSDGGLALYREAEADFRIYPTATAGTTRIEDLACLHGWDRILIIEPTTAQVDKLLAAADLGIAYIGQRQTSGRLRIACIHEDAWAILRTIHDPELPLATTDLLVATALREYGPQVLAPLTTSAPSPQRTLP